MADEQPPKVFMSYSWTDEEHIEWVEALATRMMANGVHVVFDQWDLKKGHDKYVFMEQMVTDPHITKVLCVCDKLYAAKADGREGGVGTESQIISKELYEKVKQQKFIPLVREKDESGKPYLPIFFGARMYYDFSSDEGFEDEYETLLRDILGAPKKKRPPLGKPPAYIMDEDAPRVKTTAIYQSLKDAIVKGKPHVPGLLKEYCETFTEALEDYRITYDRRPDWDEVVVDSIAKYLPYRDNFVEFLLTVTGYLPQSQYEQELHDLLERTLSYENRPEHVSQWNEMSLDNYRFVMFELFLYTIAILIRSNRSDVAANLIESAYFVPRSHGGDDIREESARSFSNHIPSLDELRDRRLKLNRLSVTADMIKERATNPKIPFRELLQVDFLLFVRPYFPKRGHLSSWYPRCIGYSTCGSSAFPLFARAVSPRDLDLLKNLLKITSLADLVAHLENFLRNPDAFRGVERIPFFTSSVQELVNFERLQGIVASGR